MQTFIEERVDDEDRDHVLNDADRIALMADEPGQVALLGATTDTETVEQLPNGIARAVWMLVAEPARFEDAEQVRYTDSRRYGRMWDGFVGAPGQAVARTDEALEMFKTAIRHQFRSRNAGIEICDRTRTTRKGRADKLVQVGIYREGRSSERKAFVGGHLDRLADHPVIQATITYQESNGVIEVVANNRETRQDLVRLFAEHLLRARFDGERLPVRQYTLDRLCKPFLFLTDPEDKIEHVRLTLLRLVPLDTQTERVTVECLRGAQRSIWQVAHDRFGDNDPLQDGYVVTKAAFTITFREEKGRRGQRTLPVNITPKGCDLKDRTEREQLVADKYLHRWGLLQNV